MSHSRIHDNGQEIGGRIKLQLTVTDPEVVAGLNKHAAGEQRNDFAKSALLGVLAPRQASGLLDADAVRREGERLMNSAKEMLTAHATKTVDGVSNKLSHYSDPAAGALPQRLNRLVSKDGELGKLRARHIGDDASVLSRLVKGQRGCWPGRSANRC